MTGDTAAHRLQDLQGPWTTPQRKKETRMQAPSRCGRRAAARRSMAAAVVVLSLAGCQASGVKPEDAAQALATATLSRAVFDEETRSWGVEPTSSYRSEKFHAPTPNTIAGATVVTTGELLERMRGASPPVLVDVLGGKSHRTLPGALWLKGAGEGLRGSTTCRRSSPRRWRRRRAATRAAPSSSSA